MPLAHVQRFSRPKLIELLHCFEVIPNSLKLILIHNNSKEIL
jgi:hypothetical protein